MKSVGIDIGSTHVRITEITSSNRGNVVTYHKQYKLSTNPTQDKDLEIIDFLRGEFSRYDKSSTQFNFCLKQDRISVHNKTFPFNDRLKIQKSLPFELEDDIPFDSDDVIFDAKLIKQVGNQSEVIACAVPKVHIEKIIQFAKDSGVELHLVTSEGFAFANLIENWNSDVPHFPAPPPQLNEEIKPEINIKVYAHIGHQQTLITAYENSRLVSTKTIYWGSKNISEAISKKYSLPVIEAQKELENKGFVLLRKNGASFDQTSFSEVIGQCLRDFGRDIQLFFLELKSSMNAHIEDVSLTGYGNQISQIHPYLTQVLNIKVNRGDLLNSLQHVQVQTPFPDAHGFVISLGSAIEGLRRPRNPAVNFLKGDFALENKQLKNLISRWGKTAQLSAAFLVLFVIYSQLRMNISAGLSEKANESLKAQAVSLANMTKKQANEASIQRYIKNNRKRILELNNIASVIQMNSSLDILKMISESTPGKDQIKLEIKKLLIEDQNARIEGYVQSAKELSLLSQSLKSITLDGKVNEAPSLLPALNGRKAFALNIKISRGMEKDK